MKELIEPFKSFWQFLLVNFIIGLLSSFIFLTDPFHSFGHFMLGSVWGMLIFVTQWLGHSYIQTQIAKKYSWMEKPVQRILLTIVSVILYSIIAFILVQALMNYLVFGKVPDYILSFKIRQWLIPIFISFFVSLIAASYGFFVNLKSSITEKERLKREMLSYKYEALRNQINPHFMFNSLNVLSDLVYEDQKTAVKFIHQFSDIYRYVLDSREQELVTLQEEVDFINKYVFLLKTRFENKLDVQMDIQVKPDDLIVPLSMQLLIENAVKHNEVSKANPLVINISRTKDELTITNPIQLKNSSDDSKKIGLKNLQQQFSYFTDKKPVINTENNAFTVQLPILKNEK